jgi:hypothetical protein
MRHSAILTIVLLAQCAAFSQESFRPVFEVASVRAVKETEHAEGFYSTGNVPRFTGDMAQLSYPEASLTGLLCRAYDVVPLRVIAPDWARTQRYSVMAKIPSGTTKEMLPLMFQNLLADRFQLKAPLGDARGIGLRTHDCKGRTQAETICRRCEAQLFHVFSRPLHLARFKPRRRCHQPIRLDGPACGRYGLALRQIRHDNRSRNGFHARFPL